MLSSKSGTNIIAKDLIAGIGRSLRQLMLNSLVIRIRISISVVMGRDRDNLVIIHKRFR